MVFAYEKFGVVCSFSASRFPLPASSRQNTELRMSGCFFIFPPVLTGCPCYEPRPRCPCCGGGIKVESFVFVKQNRVEFWVFDGVLRNHRGEPARSPINTGHSATENYPLSLAFDSVCSARRTWLVPDCIGDVGNEWITINPLSFHRQFFFWGACLQ